MESGKNNNDFGKNKMFIKYLVACRESLESVVDQGDRLLCNTQLLDRSLKVKHSATEQSCGFNPKDLKYGICLSNNNAR